jgi:mRNA interferase RelE/StbE
LNWTIEGDQAAIRQLRRIDPVHRQRIRAYLNDLTQIDDPRARGKGLTGALSGLWRYRVGDYRLVCEIRQERLVILAVTIGHRSMVDDG